MNGAAPVEVELAEIEGCMVVLVMDGEMSRVISDRIAVECSVSVCLEGTNCQFVLKESLSGGIVGMVDLVLFS